MKRHLEESDLKHLADDDLRLLLSEQFETHRRIREQAQSIIRMTLAGAGLLVAVIGYQLLPDIDPIVSIVSNARRTLEAGPLFQTVQGNTLFVAVLFAITAFGLLFSAVMKSIGVLNKNGPVPISRHKTLDREFTSGEKRTGGKTLRDWIFTNDSRLVDAEREVEQSFTHIWAAFVMGALAVFLGVSSYLAVIEVMGFAHMLVLALGFAVAVYYLKDPVLAFYRRSREEGFREALSAAMDVFDDRYLHSGIDGTMKVMLIIFYGAYWPYSVPVAEYWLGTVVF